MRTQTCVLIDIYILVTYLAISYACVSIGVRVNAGYLFGVAFLMKILMCPSSSRVVRSSDKDITLKRKIQVMYYTQNTDRFFEFNVITLYEFFLFKCFYVHLKL